MQKFEAQEVRRVHPADWISKNSKNTNLTIITSSKAATLIATSFSAAIPTLNEEASHCQKIPPPHSCTLKRGKFQGWKQVLAVTKIMLADLRCVECADVLH